MQAIVLVGGEGTRLRPLTDATPKPALTLVDRPFLAYMVEWLGGHGVDEVVLACGFEPARLRAALGEGERSGVRLTYVEEPEPLGTAGAFRFAAEQLGDRLDERFLALNGDVLTDLDLGALLDFHAERGARATIGLYPVEDSSAFGLVSRAGDGAVTEFAEKTGAVAPGEINAGAYVLERSVLDLIPAGRKVSIETEVFPRLVGDGLHGIRLDGYWVDIGTPERYLQASWDILEGRRWRRACARPRRASSSTRAQPSTRAPGSARGPSSGPAPASPPAPRSANRCCWRAPRSASTRGSSARSSARARPPPARLTAPCSPSVRESRASDER